MKGRLCLIGLVITLLTSSSQAQCPAPQTKTLKVMEATLREAQVDVDDYNATVSLVSQVDALATLKYQRLQLKYVTQTEDVELIAKIHTLQKILQEKIRKLKER